MNSTNSWVYNPKDKNRDISTVSQSRLELYEPTLKLPKGIIVTRSNENAWGKITVSGRLCQAHQNLLEISINSAERTRVSADGRLVLLIDPSKLSRELSPTKSRYSYSAMREQFSDMENAKLTIENKDLVSARILDMFTEKNAGRVVAVPMRGTGMVMVEKIWWIATFSSAWTCFLHNDLPTRYRGQIKNIIKLRHGASQALARLMLGHSGEASLAVEKALNALGVTRRRDKVRREWLADTDQLAAMGIALTPTLVKIMAAKAQ
ncbi:MAG: hypothetical protein M0Z50_19155 [Planctomycetia bacterium]|nr:hypothetical protein [Planctomycetia bacterium]